MLRLRPCDRYHWPQSYRTYWQFGRHKPSIINNYGQVLDMRLWSMVAWGRFRSEPYRERGRRAKVVTKRRGWVSDLRTPWRYFAHAHYSEGTRIWPPRLEAVRRWKTQWRAISVQPVETLPPSP